MALIIKIISNNQEEVKKHLLNFNDYDVYSISEDNSMFAMELKKIQNTGTGVAEEQLKAFGNNVK
jgi:hypothetical protein